MRTPPFVFEKGGKSREGSMQPLLQEKHLLTVHTFFSPPSPPFFFFCSSK